MQRHYYFCCKSFVFDMVFRLTILQYYITCKQVIHYKSFQSLFSHYFTFFILWSNLGCNEKCQNHFSSHSLSKVIFYSKYMPMVYLIKMFIFRNFGLFSTGCFTDLKWNFSNLSQWEFRLYSYLFYSMFVKYSMYESVIC